MLCPDCPKLDGTAPRRARCCADELHENRMLVEAGEVVTELKNMAVFDVDKPVLPLMNRAQRRRAEKRGRLK